MQTVLRKLLSAAHSCAFDSLFAKSNTEKIIPNL